MVRSVVPAFDVTVTTIALPAFVCDQVTGDVVPAAEEKASNAATAYTFRAASS